MAKRILLLSAYDAISHRMWAKQLQQMFGEVEWTTVQAKPRHFAWALRGRPLQWFLEPQTRALLQREYDALVVTSMVDLAALFACFPVLARVPSLLYMHENQFVYPANEDIAESLRKSHRVDACMVQIYAMMAASQIVFNSRYNQRSACHGLRAFLKLMPVSMDPQPLMEKIESAFVVGVPIEAQAFLDARSFVSTRPLTLVWNHRWEFDKGPDRFLLALEELEELGEDFRLILLGEAFGGRHAAYETILSRHEQRILHHGMVQTRAGYFGWLAQGDLLVSTSLHEFQGLSMLEGAAAGLWPLAPARLAYQEIYPECCLYPSHLESPTKEAHALVRAIQRVGRQRASGKLDLTLPGKIAAGYSAKRLAPEYRAVFERLGVSSQG